MSSTLTNLEEKIIEELTKRPLDTFHLAKILRESTEDVWNIVREMEKRGSIVSYRRGMIKVWAMKGSIGVGRRRRSRKKGE